MKTFADFEIWVGAQVIPSTEDSPGGFHVQVFSSPAGPATGELKLDINAEDFQTELAQVRGVGPDLALRQSFGRRLFEALFQAEVRDAWMASRGQVDAGGADGLRLRLWITVPELAALPWELLWDVWDKGFLATAANTVISRYLPVPEPPALLGQKRLRILVVVESPQRLPPIEPNEVKHLENAIRDLGDATEYQILHNATVSQIHNALQHNYHVLHFLGHGRGGQLLLTKDNQEADPIDDRAFAQLFSGRRSLRLVVLNACYSSQVEGGGLFAGVGPALVQKRVPAVVAMQYPFVQLDTAGRFSRAFYGALANGLPVDVAVNEARQSLSAGDLLADRDWSTPVLYMGTRGGRILDILSREADEVGQAWQSVRTAARESDEATAALTELTQRFQDITARHQRLEKLVEISNQLHDLQTAFDRCRDIVKQADRNVASFQVTELSQVWQYVQQNRLGPLQVFVKTCPDVDTAVWFPSLMEQATSIDDSLTQLALKSLVDSVKAFGKQLAQAKAYVRQELNQAIDDLIAFSNQTLGRLDVA